jgi:hypothetical protein
MTEQMCMQMKGILGAIHFSSDGMDPTMNVLNKKPKVE